MRQLVKTLIVGAAVLFCIAVSTASTLTPVSSTISLVANANAEGTMVTNSDMMTQGSSENNLFASVDALANGGATSVEAMGNVFAKFNSFDPDQGSITFSNLGWNITAGPTCTFAACGAHLNHGLDVNYTFTESVLEYFSLNYDVGGFGTDNGVPSTFGLNGFQICFEGACNDYPFGASGTLVFELFPGPTYSLTIQNQANILVQGTQTLMQQENGVFYFYTSPIPEPSTLVMICTGLIGVAGVFRRKRIR